VPLPGDRLKATDITRLLGYTDVEFVWRNEDGGFTFRYDGGSRYFTWVPNAQRDNLLGARERSRWVGDYVRVPDFTTIEEAFGGYWTTSAALHGHSAVSPWGVVHPLRAVHAIATGLRQLHNSAPVSTCPFQWHRDASNASARVREGDAWRHNPDDLFATIPTSEALSILSDGIQDDSDLVVCHGDPCSPNTILDEGGFVGLVDIGALGVANRWADLAVATWSIHWNFGPGWDSEFYQTYGIEPDEHQLLFYRLIWATG